MSLFGYLILFRETLLVQSKVQLNFLDLPQSQSNLMAQFGISAQDNLIAADLVQVTDTVDQNIKVFLSHLRMFKFDAQSCVFLIPIIGQIMLIAQQSFGLNRFVALIKGDLKFSLRVKVAVKVQPVFDVRRR